MEDKGGKQWQSNWEAHVDFLEDKVTGPLYKTVLRPKEKNVIKKIFTGPAKMSVSRINQLVNVFIMLIWVLLAMHAAWPIEWLQGGLVDKFVSHKYQAIAALSAFFASLILWLGRTGGGMQKHAADRRESRIEYMGVASTPWSRLERADDDPTATSNH